jgi:hypothetical protein
MRGVGDECFAQDLFHQGRHVWNQLRWATHARAHDFAGEKFV